MINSKLHGILDYLVVAFLVASPSIFHLPPQTTVFTYGLAAMHLVLTMLTAYEPGTLKIIPFRIHGWIELFVVIALGALTFYIDSVEGHAARNFYIGFTGAIFLVWLLTNYKSAPAIPKEEDVM
ncbi:hypothetical protein AAEO56_01670 [Flavobacterium sp. DGU11]|uniref:SPW repeat-containing protein n=1 Tax=Flavobacterium arundinis TaxID=3139143 RepID=A0ABU9HS11_9FLAO